jgi:hypothetical protein
MQVALYSMHSLPPALPEIAQVIVFRDLLAIPTA